MAATDEADAGTAAGAIPRTAVATAAEDVVSAVELLVAETGRPVRVVAIPERADESMVVVVSWLAWGLVAEATRGSVDARGADVGAVPLVETLGMD